MTKEANKLTIVLALKNCSMRKFDDIELNIIYL